MRNLKPWALAPFELIEHAEMHLKSNSDFDKRMALVSFDNSIESSISTYLMLNPTQRKGQQFQKSDIEKWQTNYHSQIGFIKYFVLEIVKQQMEVEIDDIIFYHGLRNELYHKGNGFVPAEIHIQGIRKAAIWIFSTLFEDNAEELLVKKSDNTLGSIQDSASNLLPENAFLETFSTFKKDLNSLLEIIRSQTAREEIKLSTVEALREIIGNDPEILSAQNISLLEKAGEIRNAIIQGKPINEASAELRNISSELELLAEQVDSKLRDYQKQIVESATQATHNAINSQNRKVGVILQTQGSGLGTSLISFVLRIKVNPISKHLPILVISDRTEIREQLYNMLQKSLENNVDLAINATGRSSMISGLSHDPPKIVFATLQLTRLDDLVPIIEKDCLVVGYNIQPSSEFIKLIPKGFYILFTSTLTKEQEIFGEVIEKYSLNQAIQDSVVVPIMIERRYIPNAWNSQENQKSNLSFLAQDILPHFELRQRLFHGKGLIVVPNIEFGDRLQMEFLANKPDAIGIIGMIHTRISHTVRSVLFERFNDENDPLSLIVTTGVWLTGTDNPLVHTVYLTKPVSDQIIWQIMGRINHKYKNKQNALLVDYADTNWSKIEHKFQATL